MNDELVGFDPFNPAHNAEPLVALAEARSRCPVGQPRPGFFVLTSDADVRAAIANTSQMSNEGNFALEGESELPVPTITMMDPPEHTALRARLRQWFAPPQLRRLEPRVREIVAEVLSELPQSGTVDLYDMFLAKVPARVVYEFLGLPPQDWERLERCADRVNEELPRPVAHLPEFQELAGYLATHLERVSQAPPTGEGVLDGLVHPVEGDPLTPVELLVHTIQLIAAGTDTTRSAVANLMYELLREPNRWERVVEDPSLINAAMEESLRLDAPIQYVLRTVKSEMTLGEQTLPAGAKVLLSLQSAHRDSATWGETADVFDLDRPRSAAHLAFGYGAHTCLGQPLSRIEIVAMVEALLTRFPEMRLTHDFVWEKEAGDMLRRPERLDVDLHGAVTPDLTRLPSDRAHAARVLGE